MNRLRIFCSLLLLPLLLLIAGCGGSRYSSAPKDTISMVLSSEPSTLDPAMTYGLAESNVQVELFEGLTRLDEKGVPKGWDNVVRDQVVALPGNQHAVCVTNYFMHGLSGRRSIGERPYERQVRVSFRAWGQGKLSVWFNRYLDTPKPNGAFHRQNIQPGLSVGARGHRRTEVLFVCRENPAEGMGFARLPAGLGEGSEGRDPA